MTADVFIAGPEPGLLRTYELWVTDAFDGLGVHTTEHYPGDEIDDSVTAVICDRELLVAGGTDRTAEAGTAAATVVAVSDVGPDDRLSTDDVDEYLVKPVRRIDLLNAIETAVLEGSSPDGRLDEDDGANRAPRNG